VCVCVCVCVCGFAPPVSGRVVPLALSQNIARMSLGRQQRAEEIIKYRKQENLHCEKKLPRLLLGFGVIPNMLLRIELMSLVD